MSSTVPMSPPPPAPMMSSPGGAPMMMPTRPTGVTILAVIYFIGAGACVLFGLLAFVLGATIANMLSSAAGSAFPGGLAAGIGALVGILLLFVAAILVVWGLGFWRGWTWLWYVSGILWILGVVSNLFSIGRNTGSAIFSIALDLFLLWYISQKGVQRWFKVDMNLPWAK